MTGPVHADQAAPACSKVRIAAVRGADPTVVQVPDRGPTAVPYRGPIAGRIAAPVPIAARIDTTAVRRRTARDRNDGPVAIACRATTAAANM